MLNIDRVLTLFDDLAALEALTPDALQNWICNYIVLYEDTKADNACLPSGAKPGRPGTC